MSSYRPFSNPSVIPNARVRDFRGIGGQDLRVFKYYDAKGNDISNSFFNDMQDFNLGEAGTLQLRDGCRKIEASGYSDHIEDIFFMTLGGRKFYGVQVGQALMVIDIPDANKNQILGFMDSSEEIHVASRDPVDVTPASSKATLSNEYPVADPGAFEL